MNKRIKKPVGGLLPGEPGQGKPRRGPTKPAPGPGPRPMPMTPDAKYKAMKKAMLTPGMQPGEKEQLQRIAENRGVSMKRAKEIGANRASHGLGMIGTPNPKNKKVRAGRTDVPNPRPLKPQKPGNMDGSGAAPRSGGGTPRSGAEMRKRLPVKGGK